VQHNVDALVYVFVTTVQKTLVRRHNHQRTHPDQLSEEYLGVGLQRKKGSADALHEREMHQFGQQHLRYDQEQDGHVLEVVGQEVVGGAHESEPAKVVFEGGDPLLGVGVVDEELELRELFDVGAVENVGEVLDEAVPHVEDLG
jgi:hypothetical protein